MPAPRLISEGRQHIDRYELVAEIASGGMATVFLARLSGMGGFQRFVAIKRLHPHLAREGEFVQMFLDEARLAAGIHHSNVVPILEVGASEHGYYIVMEYIEGDTLARLLARAATSGDKLPASVGLRILLDTLRGLHAAHELNDEHGQPTGLVHRDVSPQNVLVGIDGMSRITDFGVARAATRLSATRVGQLKGKLAYMSPEQASGDVDVDRRSDVFSAGVLLWEVLAARRLFKAETEAQTLARVMNGPVPLIQEACPGLSPAIAAVTMKALSRDARGRFSTCSEFADALEAAAAGILGAPKDVATHVSSVMGGEISQHREAVRAWIARSEPSQAIQMGAVAPGGTPASSVSAAAMDPRSPASQSVSMPRSRSRGPAALALLGGALLLVGGATFLLVSGTGAPAPGSGAAATLPDQARAADPSAPTSSSQPSPSGAAELDELPIATSEPAKSSAPKSGQAGPAVVKGAAPDPRVEPPAAVPAPAIAEPPPAPEPKKPKKPKAGIDLSNPYR